MLREKRISNVERQGIRVLDRYKAEGGTGFQAGEIIGTALDKRDIFEAWKKSESHNNLILPRHPFV